MGEQLRIALMDHCCAVGIVVLLLVKPSVQALTKRHGPLLRTLKQIDTTGEPCLTHQFILLWEEIKSPLLLLWVGTRWPVLLRIHVRLQGVRLRLFLWLGVIQLSIFVATSVMDNVHHRLVIYHRPAWTRHSGKQ